jgi:hypothetical protein
MRPQPSAFSCLIERVAVVFLPLHIAQLRLLSIHLQVKFVLNELRDALALSLPLVCSCRRLGCRPHSAQTGVHSAPSVRHLLPNSSADFPQFAVTARLLFSEVSTARSPQL